jgi:hypothetical protein
MCPSENSNVPCSLNSNSVQYVTFFPRDTIQFLTFLHMSIIYVFSHYSCSALLSKIPNISHDVSCILRVMVLYLQGRHEYSSGPHNFSNFIGSCQAT